MWKSDRSAGSKRRTGLVQTEGIAGIFIMDLIDILGKCVQHKVIVLTADLKSRMKLLHFLGAEVISQMIRVVEALVRHIDQLPALVRDTDAHRRAEEDLDAQLILQRPDRTACTS